MPLRDLFVYTLVYGSLPFCLFRPYIGILVWYIISYLNPHRLAWRTDFFPAAQYVGAATLLGLIFTKDRTRLPLERETVLLLLLWMMFTINTYFSLYPDGRFGAWDQWDQKSKILLMTFVTIILFIDKQKLKYLLLTIAFSLGFFGFKGGIFSILTGGAHHVLGPEGTFIGGNNSIGLALLMTISVFFYLAKEEQDQKLKIVLLATFFLSIVSIVFTHSRGAFLGLASFIFLFLLKLERRFIAGTAILIGALFMLMFVPQKWLDRMSTISSYEQDASAMGRINAWYFAWNLALDRPFTGGGFGAFHPDLFVTYAPDPYDFHDAHSIYFEMLGEQGFIALGLFISLLVSSFLSLRKLKRISEHIPSLQWMKSYSNMLELSLATYMVCGAFLGMAYFDLAYHMVAIVIILKVIARRENELLAEEEKGPQQEAKKV